MPFSRLAYAVRRQLCVPDVIIDFLHEDEKLFVVIENIGEGTAHRVSASFDPELWGVRGTVQVSNLPLFKHLSFLAPGKKLRTFLDVSSAYFNRDEPTLIDVTVRFEDDTGTDFKRSLTHNLSVYQATGPPYQNSA